jgi:hypothetical protein
MAKPPGGRGKGRISGNVTEIRPGAAKGAKAPPRAPSRLRADASKGAELTQDQIDAQARRAHVERVAALTNQHRQLDNKMDAVRQTLDELNGDRKLIRTAIGSSGIPLEVFDERYEKMKLKTKRTDLEAIERARAICSEAMGLIVTEQAQLDFAKLPEGAKVGVHWRAVGYQAGVAGEKCDPAGAGCPPEATQEYTQGWGEGQTVIAAGLKLVKADQKKDADKAAPANDSPKTEEKAPKPDRAQVIAEGTQPDWSGFDNDPVNWGEEQRRTFANWFRTLGPDDNVDIDHPGIEVAFDRMNDGVDAFTGEAAGAA